MTADEKLDMLIREQRELKEMFLALHPSSSKIRDAAAAINPGCKPTRKQRKMPQKREA